MLSPQKRNFWILLTVIAVLFTAAQMFKRNEVRNYHKRGIMNSCSMKSRSVSSEETTSSQKLEAKDERENKHKGCYYKSYTVPRREQ